MTSITTQTLDWRGILIEVRFEEQKYIDHLQVEALEPARAPLPITETGYRSHFIGCGIVQEHGGPLDYVSGWLDSSAKDRGWIAAQEAARQFSLF